MIVDCLSHNKKKINRKRREKKNSQIKTFERSIKDSSNILLLFLKKKLNGFFNTAFARSGLKKLCNRKFR